MSQHDPDRLLKRVWLVNGFLVLALLVLGGGAILVALVSEWRGESRAAVAAPAAGTAARDAQPRAVRFDAPLRVRGTETRIVLVRNGAGYQTTPMAPVGGFAASKSYASREDGPLVNVIFLPPGNAPGRLLFDRRAFIKEVSYPGESYGRADSLQTWISYEVALDDTDGNGQLDDEDLTALFVSDLDGKNLRRVLPAGWQLRAHQPLGDGHTIVVTALQAPAGADARDWKEHEAPERAFLYDVPSGQLRPFAALDSLAAQAGALLGGKPGRLAR